MALNQNFIDLKHKYIITPLVAVSLFACFLLSFSPSSYAQVPNEQETINTTDSRSLEENSYGDLGENKPVIKDEFEWQFILDLSAVYDPSLIASVGGEGILHYFVPGLIFDISYKGFFLQTNQRRSIALLGATEFGYQLVVKESWQLDFIAKAYVQGYDSELLIEYSDADEDILGGLRERDPTLGVALRYSQYFKDALFTIDFAHTHSGDDENGKSINGYIIDSFYSHLLLYRNWDIYLGAGLTYFSHDVVNNFIGISPSEATDIRAEYKANGGFRAQLEVYAQYPLSESWSFSTGITQSLFSSEIKESPIVDTNHTTQVALGVQYVF